MSEGTGKTQQVADQYRAAGHLAKALSELCEDMSKHVHPKLVDIQGPRTHSWMEKLGDMINGVDAFTEEDEWVNPIFDRAREVFPVKSEARELHALMKCAEALRRALPFIDDALDAHMVMSETCLTDECREAVADANAALSLLDEVSK